MILHTRTFAAGLACCLAWAGAAAGQQVERRTEVRSETTAAGTTTEVRRITTVMGANVVVQDGATVGKIQDIVFTDNGCIDYVVVSYESKLVLVPWTVVRVDAAQHVVQVNVTREKFLQVPTFTANNWSYLTNAQYVQQVRTAFGATASGFRGDVREGDRRPLAPGADTRQDRRDDRRDTRQDRRDDRRDTRDQRRDVENPNRPADRPPATNPPTRPGDRPPATNPPPPDRRDNRPPPPNPPDRRDNPPPPPPPRPTPPPPPPPPV